MGYKWMIITDILKTLDDQRHPSYTFLRHMGICPHPQANANFESRLNTANFKERSPSDVGE